MARRSIENMSVQRSNHDFNSKAYTFSTNKDQGVVNLGSKVYSNGQLGGSAENQVDFNYESKTNITHNGDLDSINQSSGQQQQTGMVGNRGILAHTNEHTHKLIEKKQPVLFTRKQIGDRNKRSSSAKFRSYSKLTIRKQSFIGWTSDCMLPIRNFAMAGFFYKGFADIVACFECGLVHRRWQKDDDPVKTHIYFQPDCPYVMDLIADGIQSCVDLHNLESNSCEENMEISDECTGRNRVVTAATSAISSQASTIDVRLQCKICLTNPLEITVQPCGHCSMCESCYTHIKYENNRCPICRGHMKNTIRTFFP